MIEGTVLDGRVVVEHHLPEGATVTVLLEDETAVVLSPEDEAELTARIAAAERGEVIEYTDIDLMIRDLCG
jgi:hypothetical protein